MDVDRAKGFSSRFVNKVESTFPLCPGPSTCCRLLDRLTLTTQYTVLKSSVSRRVCIELKLGFKGGHLEIRKSRFKTF